MIPIELRTARLLLDQPGDDDIDVIAESCTDPVFERFMTTPWPYEREHAVGYVHEFVPGNWATGREATWALRHPERGFLGVVGLSLSRPDRPGGMIGFWLSAAHRGQGFLPEAAAAVIDWGFDSAGLDVIRWEAVVPNVSSLVAARKLGFRFTGERPSEIDGRDGERVLSWHAELLADESRAPKDGWPL